MSSPEPDSSGRNRGRAIAVLLGAVLIVTGFLLGLAFERLVTPPAEDSAAGGAVDIGFLQDMSVHHSQAVEMSAAVLTTTDDADVRNLAFDILTAQEHQMGQMRGWLQLWDEPLFPTNGVMSWMEDSEHAGHGDHGDHGAMQETAPMTQMPGMASPAEMAGLRQAEGTERDVLFLQLMLRHHEGGLPMAEYAATHAEVPAVRNIASSMLEGQSKEISLMTTMLGQRGAEPLPMN